MNEKALRVLEYPKIIVQLTECATSQPGKALCRVLQPSDNLPEILRTQRETSDALRRIYAKGNLSFSGVRDIRPDVRRLEIGSRTPQLRFIIYPPQAYPLELYCIFFYLSGP